MHGAFDAVPIMPAAEALRQLSPPFSLVERFARLGFLANSFLAIACLKHAYGAFFFLVVFGLHEFCFGGVGLFVFG